MTFVADRNLRMGPSFVGKLTWGNYSLENQLHAGPSAVAMVFFQDGHVEISVEVSGQEE